MAKKGPDSQGAAVQASVVINEKKLKSLLKLKRTLSAEVGELTGNYRAELAQAVEKQNLHKKAYAMVTQFDKMEPEQALECWTHLTMYMDLSGIMAKIDSVAKLPLEDPPKEETGDGKGASAGGEPSKTVDLNARRAAREPALN